MAEMIEFTIGNTTTTALVALPKTPGPHPGVVVSFHHQGLDGPTADDVDHLAAEGFGAIAPNHYHVIPDGVDLKQRRLYLTDEQYAVDFRAAAEWLVAQGCDRSRLAILGHCAGGRATWVGLEGCPDLWRCGCVWYGGGALRQMGSLPSPFERLGEIRSPVTGFFGNIDKNPSPEDVDKFDAALTRFGVLHEFHRYDGADHAFTNHTGHRYNEKATTDSWTKAIAFMRKHCV
ncbi:MAG TPA: dienelactone hydrolase family protein [Beijerinckiaceae bacterium]|jgi:carboxymethylenebutenolidase|nr:dienelactone hydrolase family protein [Beijerinckiaceae bacterium]